MKLLIDADFIVYKACAAAETEIDWGDDTILVTSRFSDAYSASKREITKLQNKLGSFADIILFFSDSTNFRKKYYLNIRVIGTVRSPAVISVLSMLSEKSIRLLLNPRSKPMTVWAFMPPSIQVIS